jgi:hypothetical protein
VAQGLLNGTKSADDDKRGFYSVRAGMKPGAQNLIIPQF